MVNSDGSAVTLLDQLKGINSSRITISPSPQAKTFVEVGTVVKKASVLCIVEAMKLMNEIESEVDGTVVEVLIENGKPVEFGDKLFKIKLN